MKISDTAIDYPKVTWVFTILTFLLAILAAYKIPVQRTPPIHTAIVLVAVPYPGAEPTEVEEQVTRKIEDALQRLNNVDFIASTSMRGSSVTQVIFLDGVDGKRARDDVEHLVNEVRRLLPLGREVQPSVNDINFESSPIMLVTMAGPKGFDERTLKQIAEDVQDELETIPGVSNTQLFGGREREIHVNVNPHLMQQYRLGVNDIRSALSAFHAELPGGTLNSSEYDLQIHNETKFRNVEDIRRAIVAERDGRLITISDVADVQDTYRRLMNYAQLDGENSATIIVNKEADINSLATAKLIKERIAQVQEQFPHVRFSCTRDISQDIAQMFENLGSDAAVGGLVVLLVLGVAMGLRVSLLVVIAIPFSMAVSLVFLYFGGYAISNMVIFAYIVASGMVIDGAIIVADAIYRHLELGYSSSDAAKLGVNEVAVPVFAADLVTVAAFLPMLLVPGIMGDFLGVLPIVVSISLAGSLITDHFLVPVLAVWWFKNYVPPAGKPGTQAAADSNLVEGLWAPFYRVYIRILRWSLAHPYVIMTACAMSVTWAGMMLYYRFVGYTFFPGSDRGQFEISFEMPLGYSIEQTAKAAEAITEPLRDLKESGELIHFVTAIGSSSALASRLETDPAMGPEFGKVMVELVPPSDRKRSEIEIINEIRSKVKPVPGMSFRIEQIEEGPPGGFDVAVRLTGKNLEQLGRISRAMAAQLAKVPGTVEARSDYRPDAPQLVIEPRPGVVGLMKMTDAEVARAVQTAVLGDTAILLSLDDEDVTLRLQASEDYQRYPSDVANLMLRSPDGRLATVSELADIRRGEGLFSVNRRDRRRSVHVVCNVRKEAGIIPDDIFKVIREEILPQHGFETVQGTRVAFLGQASSDAEGVRASFTGENEERDKGMKALAQAMIIGIVLIAAILVIEFYSIRQAIVVMSTVPLSFVGVVMGMWLCRFDFSLASFIGLISLTGVVVNDAIVLVDFVNDARRRKVPLDDALVEAGTKRARAVLLTMLTSVGGMLPTFLNLSGGGEFWQPLVGAIIFGLTISAFLTLLVIPVAYWLVYPGERYLIKHPVPIAPTPPPVQIPA